MVEDRPVGIGPHLHGAARLALVAEGVHVADDRIADLAVGGGEYVERTHVDHLVYGRREGDRGAGHRGQARRPDPTGDDYVVAGDPPVVGDHRPDPSPVRLDVQHLGHRVDRQRSLLPGVLAHEGAGPQGVDHRHAGRIPSTQDHRLVEEGHQFFRLVRAYQPTLDTPALGRSHASVEFVQPFLGAGHLQAARGDADFHLLVLMLAVEGEVGHLLVVVHRIDEVGGVPGGPAGVGERALVQLHDVPPAECGKMLDHRVTDDSGADHYHPGAGREIAHPSLLFIPCSVMWNLLTIRNSIPLHR